MLTTLSKFSHFVCLSKPFPFLLVSKLQTTNSPHSLEVEEGDGEDPDADPRAAPHLGQVAPDLEVLAHHDTAGVPHHGAAHGQQNAVAGEEERRGEGSR